MTVLHQLSVGDGPGIVVVGGALATAEEYLPLGDALATRGRRSVIVQRRGRGGSPPRDPGAGIELECRELSEVVDDVKAVAVFGHSFGGLVALEAAARGWITVPLVLYEPGVSIDGSVSVAWIPRYNALLADGKRRAAFAHFVRKSGGAPPIVQHLPAWYLRLILPMVTRRSWPHMEPLLEANSDEHRLVGTCDNRVSAYTRIIQPVQLLGGSKSPPSLTRIPFAAMTAHLPDCHAEILPGLGHFAPDHEAPDAIAAKTHELLAILARDPNRPRTRGSS